MYNQLNKTSSIRTVKSVGGPGAVCLETAGTTVQSWVKAQLSKL
jgi:hypothetical protein